MEIFISWSGPRSGALAQALRDWLPQIMNSVRPWLSKTDIEKGARWAIELAGKLEGAKAGIICLTPGNLHADWLLFEAGALSKSVQSSFICPLLLGLEPSALVGPLTQFQATLCEKDEILKLLKTLNRALLEPLSDGHIEKAFQVWWPELDLQIRALPPENGAARPHRDQREIVEEILELVRKQDRLFPASALPAEDQMPVLANRAWRAVRAIHGSVGGGASGPVQRGSSLALDMQVRIGSEVRKYNIVVPVGLSPEQMESIASYQVKEADKALATRLGSETQAPSITAQDTATEKKQILPPQSGASK